MSFNKDILLKPTNTIKEAMQRLDDVGLQIVVVVDDSNRLLGTVTDGDIRRGILSECLLQDRIEKIMNREPITLCDKSSQDEIRKVGMEAGVKQVILLNDEKVSGLYYLEPCLDVEKNKKNKVILMAGGLGQRLRPLTDDRPKPLLKVGEKPILETIISNFRKYGFNDFLVSVNYKSKMIQEYFGDGKEWNVSIEYIEEDKKLGTAGALSLVNSFDINEPFFVMNGDLLTNVNLKKLLDYHIQAQSSATVAVREFDFQVPYGVVKGEKGVVEAIVEKPIHSFFVSAGIYVLNPNVLNLIPRDTYFEMPSLLNELLFLNRVVSSFPIHEYWLDIGRMDEYKKANLEYQKYFV